MSLHSGLYLRSATLSQLPLTSCGPGLNNELLLHGVVFTDVCDLLLDNWSVLNLQCEQHQ